jgi:hypothetical protein
VLISTPPNLNPASFKEVKADIQDQFAEGRRYLVVRSGQIDAKVLGNSAEMEYTEGRIFNREAVDRGMGVPAGLWAKEATRANSDAAESVVIKHTVYPLHCLVAEEITAQVLARYYEGEVYGQFEDIRPEDRELKVRERSVYWKVYTVDEARAEVGLGPHPDPEVGGKLVQGGQPGAPEGAQQEDGSLLIEAPGMPMERRGAAEDLRRWRSVARRMVKAGENPGGYEFESEAISPGVQQAVRQMLDGATTEDEVRAAFAVADNGHRNAWIWTPDYP